LYRKVNWLLPLTLLYPQRNYKKRQKELKITKAILETNEQIAACYDDAAPTNNLSQAEKRLKQDWLNIHDVSELLGIPVAAYP